MAINNRYEFMFYVECENCNPNGDPDMGNAPRIDPQSMHGYITDVAVKRRIRNYIQIAYEGQDGMGIVMQNATNINRFIAQAREKTGNLKDKPTREVVDKARQYICDNYFDARAFGAVLSTGANAGQVRGPIQIAFGKSVDKILPLDISITRMVVSEGDKGLSSEQLEKLEHETDADKLRTMGRKQFIPYGLYEVKGFISANLANETGFDEDDLKAFFEAILNMYEHDRSSSKGRMSVLSPLVIFKHVGTDSDETQRIRQAKLGCAPAHKLFELVSIEKTIDLPRSYKDYKASICLENVPKGIDVGFMTSPYEQPTWNKIPEGCDLFG